MFKVAFLPFAYVLDLWRWEIFRGNVTPAEYNCRYWKLRLAKEYYDKTYFDSYCAGAKGLLFNFSMYSLELI